MAPFKSCCLVIGLALTALLQVASVRSRAVRPTEASLGVAAEGSFKPNGEYPGEPFPHAVAARTWGSWSGADDNIGRLVLGPFPAPRTLRLGLSGYPNQPNNSLYVERVDSDARVAINQAAVGERWHVVDVALPESWANQPIRLVAIDRATGLGGWFGVSEPIRGGRGDGLNGLLETFAAWATTGLLLGSLWMAAAHQLAGWAGNRTPARSPGDPVPARLLGFSGGWLSLAPHWVPLGAGAMVAAVGYGAFWAYWLNPFLGILFSWTVIGLGALLNLWPAFAGRGARVKARERLAAVAPQNRNRSPSAGAAWAEMGMVLQLLLAVGAFHLAVLHLFPTSQDFYTVAANRFREAMPVDNLLSHVLADRLFESAPVRNPGDEWLSSDRPPLQSGWQLLIWSAGKALQLDLNAASGTAAVWLQLLWVAGAYGLLRTFAVRPTRAAGWIAALALCGFFLQNTTFTWPKLSAGAFGCGAFALLFLPGAGTNPRANGIWAAAFAALAWLSHGGVAFSFLPLLPVLFWRALRGEGRAWLPGAAVLLAAVLPWLLYQKVYDPPANRLFKWHLAGQSAKDARGTWESIRDAYVQIGWRGAWSNKITNFHAQVFGDWRHLVDVSAATAPTRRAEEFFFPGRALTWWPVLLGLALLARVITGQRAWPPPGDLVILGSWLAATVVVWCLLMFGAYQAAIHQGSYALMIGLFVGFSVALERSGRGWLPVITVLQAITLGTTWVIGNPTLHGPATGLALVVLTGAALGWLVLRAARDGGAQPEAGPSRDPHPPGSQRTSGLSVVPAPLRDGARASPRLARGAWLVLGCAVLLFLRKPWALHTPQLWAEDGSIFLTQDEQLGFRAWWEPYNGYLHLLPRLIAWTARHTADPAWWPAIYNGLAFAITVGLFARMASPRVALPGKPWLMLAFVLTVGTGEVLMNVTNLQWVTAFFLLLQLFTAPATTWRQRLADLAIVLVVGANGPFAILFLPLFAWRAWRSRTTDTFLALAALTACAGGTAWLLWRSGGGLNLQGADAPFRPIMFLSIIGSRLVTWPLLGPAAVRAWPSWVHAGLAVLVITPLLVRALRAGPQRDVRALVVAAFALITVASVYRVRADTWADDNLVNGDRYFYIPRVLLAWLLIWECRVPQRAIAWPARTACALAVMLHVPHFILPAPPDYKWAEHCDPIRRGVPANISTLPEGWWIEYPGRPARP